MSAGGDDLSSVGSGELHWMSGPAGWVGLVKHWISTAEDFELSSRAFPNGCGIGMFLLVEVMPILGMKGL